MKRLGWVVVVSLLLSGCVALVIAGAATGLIVYDSRSVVVMERDTRIAYRINHTIATDSRFKGSHVTAYAFNQVVLLVGQTPIASMRVVAEKIAHGTPSARRVYNEITLEPETAVVDRGRDAWISAEVRARLLTKPRLSSGSIRVVTDNQVVYLMGVVSSRQASLAVDAARRIDGVRRVVKLFIYRRG